MKKISFFTVLLFCATLPCSFLHAQVKIVTSVVGTYMGSTSLTGDWVPATNASVFGTSGIATDKYGNLYVSDYGNSKVRKVDAASGLIHTLTGSGISGFTGDGGPASAAKVAHPQTLCVDKLNNLYILDASNSRIRKISGTTNIITTVAGGGVSTADGVPATTADIGAAKSIALDTTGTLYIADATGLVRKVNTGTGIITTITGATSAECLMFDKGNNLFFSTSTGLIKKRNAVTTVISTVAGGGSLTSDGAAALAADLTGYTHFCIDTAGNIYMGNGTLIREIDAASYHVSTVAGCGGAYTEGIPAIEAFASNYMFCIDKANNIYYSNNASNVRKIGATFTAVGYTSADSFNVTINMLCSGPQITATTNNFHPGASVKAYFGDGQSAVGMIGSSCASGGGYVVFDHIYAHSGTYTMKFVLYLGTVAVDSTHRTYNYVFCNTIPVKYYFDMDSNCVKDAGDPYIFVPILTKVDSNGIAIDTISATNGMYYNAYGANGDVYKFTPIGIPTGLRVKCPSTGYITDTLSTLLYNSTPREFSFVNSGIPGFDLNVSSSFRLGSHHLGGQIIVSNYAYTATTATVTAEINSKYATWMTSPAPTSTSGHTVTWNVSLSNNPSSPTVISLDGETGTFHTPGDTIHNTFYITPFGGDANPADNICNREDTSKTGYDPNYIEVSPAICISPTTKRLTYTIHFENTGNDTAFNIYVMDTLAPTLNPNTLRIVSASAAMDISFIKEGGYTIAKFNFPDINLQDSSHHGFCDAMVVYSIERYNNVPDNTHISNRAGIYFDDNPVVMTNQVDNVTGCDPNGVPQVQQHETSIYPNPATSELIIKTESNTYSTYTITNSIGQSLVQAPVAAGETKADIKALPAGIYYITLRGNDGTMVRKFVKM